MENNSPIEEIYRRYAKPINIYVLSMCKNQDLADDITADTFLKALKNIDTYSGKNILTWLCTIAKNTLYDYQKKKEQLNIPLTDEMEHTLARSKDLPEKSLIDKDESMVLYKNLQKLEPQSREVVYFRMFTELSFKEIGAILNKNENSARVIFYRSKNKLKGLMDEDKKKSFTEEGDMILFKTLKNKLNGKTKIICTILAAVILIVISSFYTLFSVPIKNVAL